jgi:hypothetical protein
VLILSPTHHQVKKNPKLLYMISSHDGEAFSPDKVFLMTVPLM